MAHNNGQPQNEKVGPYYVIHKNIEENLNFFQYPDRPQDYSRVSASSKINTEERLKFALASQGSR